MYITFFKFVLFLDVFLLNGAVVGQASVDVLPLVSMGHVAKNARLVDVDGAATGVCAEAISFVVLHGRSFSHQIHHSTKGCLHTITLVVVRSAVREAGDRRGSTHVHSKVSVMTKMTLRCIELGTISHSYSVKLTFSNCHIAEFHLRHPGGGKQTKSSWILHGDTSDAETLTMFDENTTKNRRFSLTFADDGQGVAGNGQHLMAWRTMRRRPTSDHFVDTFFQLQSHYLLWIVV